MSDSNIRFNVELTRAEREFTALLASGDATKVFNFLYGLKLDLMTELLRRQGAMTMTDSVVKQWILRGCTSEITSKIRNSVPVRQILV